MCLPLTGFHLKKKEKSSSLLSPRGNAGHVQICGRDPTDSHTAADHMSLMTVITRENVLHLKAKYVLM